MENQENWPTDRLDFSECDTLSVRKLVSAIFSEALCEAALLVQWADFIITRERGEHNLPIYNTSIHFLSAHENLSSFLRCPFGTELMDWLQYFSERVEADEYWKKLQEYLDESRYAIGVAQKVVNRGAPPQ